MTNDEIETRITRLETRLTATQVLVHSLLPATVPSRRDQILKQFGQWCGATEAKAIEDDGDPLMVDWHLAELATMYTSLEGALKLIAAWEAKKK
jgi:hypothetical protein